MDAAAAGLLALVEAEGIARATDAEVIVTLHLLRVCVTLRAGGLIASG